MPKTIPLCGDGRGCKFLPKLSCDCVCATNTVEYDILRESHSSPITDGIITTNIIGCSAYEEKPVDKVSEFMEWYKKLQPTWGTCHLEETEAKLREIFGGKE